MRIFSATAEDPMQYGLLLASDFIDALRLQNTRKTSAILSVFNPSERKVFLVMVDALRAMGAEPEYRNAMKKALCETLYKELKGDVKK